MRRFLTAGAVMLLLGGCATSPHKTVSDLNRRDPEYRTRDCRQARAAVARYDDNKDGRAVIAAKAEDMDEALYGLQRQTDLR